MSKSNRKKGNIWALLGKKGNIMRQKMAIFFFVFRFISANYENQTPKKGQYSHTSKGQYLCKTLIYI